MPNIAHATTVIPQQHNSFSDSFELDWAIFIFNIELTKANTAGIAPPKEIIGMTIKKITKIQSNQGFIRNVKFIVTSFSFFLLLNLFYL